MANISFRLNNGNSIPKDKKDKEFSIYMRYKYGRKVDLNKSIKQKVQPTLWDAKKQMVKNRSEAIHREVINATISKIKYQFESFERGLISNGKETTKVLAENCFKEFFNVNEKERPRTLFEYIKHFRNSKEAQSKTKATQKEYNHTERFLKRFNDEVYNIDFDNINIQFYYDFIEWAENLKNLKGQRLSKNYIGKHIKTLKTFLSNATDEGINTNLAFRSKKFKVLKEEVTNVYLNLEELKTIYQLDLTKNPSLDQARDLFLIGAYTGLRVSDFNNLKPENIFSDNGSEFLKVKTKKTKKEVVIPLRPEVRAIIQKHGNKPPNRMYDQKINQKIKVVCMNAGIEENIHTEKTRGGNKIISKKPKYQLIQTHTARRSFCTNAYLSGMNTLDIMQISGHTSEKTFLNYIKANALEKAKKISKHPFFIGNPLKVVSNE